MRQGVKQIRGKRTCKHTNGKNYLPPTMDYAWEYELLSISLGLWPSTCRTVGGDNWVGGEGGVSPLLSPCLCMVSVDIGLEY
jgi:hypothetical protein